MNFMTSQRHDAIAANLQKIWRGLVHFKLHGLADPSWGSGSIASSVQSSYSWFLF